MTVFLATLGQRPEAITMVLDALHPRYRFGEVNILHTDPQRSGISTAYTQLMDTLHNDYDELTVRGEVLAHGDGTPIVDIIDSKSAEDYYLALLEVLRRYRASYRTIHLLVSGGRKAMSIYASMAATVLFGEHDRLWTIVAPPELMKMGLYHLPAGKADHIQMVSLPVYASRFLPGELANQTAEDVYIQLRIAPREAFLQELTKEEYKLVEVLQFHPYYGNAELAEQLQKDVKTIETQLSNIYSKLSAHFDLTTINAKRKRQALLDVLAGRV